MVTTRWSSTASVTPTTIHVTPARTRVSPASGTLSVPQYSQLPSGKRSVIALLVLLMSVSFGSLPLSVRIRQVRTEGEVGGLPPSVASKRVLSSPRPIGHDWVISLAMSNPTRSPAPRCAKTAVRIDPIGCHERPAANAVASLNSPCASSTTSGRPTTASMHGMWTDWWS